MRRTNFYNIVTTDGVREFDFLNNSLDGWVANNTPAYHRVKDTDLMRPDLISYKYYATVAFWWLICYVNTIHDPFNDLAVGQILEIPNILDIYAFGRNYQMVRNVGTGLTVAERRALL